LSLIEPLSPLKLGTIHLDLPVYQAALSGLSDWPMRLIARRLGAPFALGEVWLDQFVLDVAGGKKAGRYLRVTDEDHPCGAQVMGSDPELMVRASRQLVEFGFDLVDINFGCPVKKVLGRRRGGFLLSQPELALEIVARVRDDLPPEIPVTVKMRRGVDESQESRDRFFTIFDGSFDRGAEAITVHGRSVEQRYVGPSSWDFLREVKLHAGADRTVLGSGDLFLAEDCLRMIRETGVDGVAIARGAIGNPWIFQQTAALFRGEPIPKPPTVLQQRAVIEEHYRLAEDVYGFERSSQRMRRFGIKYSKLHPRSDEVKRAFIAVRWPEDLDRIFREYYSEDGPGRYPEPAEMAE
jgi:tRNA-dihydrouridine synthase B